MEARSCKGNYLVRRRRRRTDGTKVRATGALRLRTHAARARFRCTAKIDSDNIAAWFSIGIRAMAESDGVEKRSRGRRRTTLADVARHVGVSSMTASRAITKPELVTPALREQIAKAMEELGYVPNR